MKKVLSVFLMLFAFTIYANNSVEGKESKVDAKKIEVTNYQLIKKNNSTDIEIVVCYVNIRNSETGETKKVYGYGSSLESCGQDAYRRAHALVKELNNQ